MNTKRFSSSIMVVLLVFVAVCFTGGCGGSGSSHNTPLNNQPQANKDLNNPQEPEKENEPEKTEQNVVLLDALLSGSVVEIDLNWHDEIKTFTFENVNDEVFKKINEPENLDSSLLCGQYGILTFTAKNKQYSDEWITMTFNCSHETYCIHFSDLIWNTMYHFYEFISIRVNGIDISNQIQYEWDEYEQPELASVTLEDAEKDGSTIDLDVYLNNVYHHVIFRNENGNFKLIDGIEEEYEILTMSVSEGEWLNVLFQVDDSLWMSIRFYYDEQYYEVYVSDEYSGKLESIHINGVNITDSLTWRYNWYDSNGRPARLEDVLQKNTQVVLDILWDGDYHYFTFFNYGNKILCETETEDFGTASLVANSENMVFTFVSKDNKDKWMKITFDYYISGSCHVEVSPLIPANEQKGFGFEDIIVNSMVLTDQLYVYK